MEDKVFLCEFTIGTIYDDHVLFSIRNGTLVADVRSRKSIISSYHNTVNLSLLEIFDRAGCFLLQRVFEDLKTIENQIFLHLIPSPCF